MVRERSGRRVRDWYIRLQNRGLVKGSCLALMWRWRSGGRRSAAVPVSNAASYATLILRTKGEAQSMSRLNQGDYKQVGRHRQLQGVKITIRFILMQTYSHASGSVSNSGVSIR